jgi:hypothetical protein
MVFTEPECGSEAAPAAGISCRLAGLPFRELGGGSVPRGEKAGTKKAGAQSAKTANGFEATLWAAADKLRGNMDAAEYKHVALGLIFLKYISDRFEERRSEILAEPDPPAELAHELAEDRDAAAPDHGPSLVFAAHRRSSGSRGLRTRCVVADAGRGRRTRPDATRLGRSDRRQCRQATARNQEDRGGGRGRNAPPLPDRGPRSQCTARISILGAARVGRLIPASLAGAYR